MSVLLVSVHSNDSLLQILAWSKMFEFSSREVPRSALIDDPGQIRSGNKRVTGSAVSQRGPRLTIFWNFTIYIVLTVVVLQCQCSE